MNALKQVTVTAGGFEIRGFSVSALATYVQIPELDVCFDMGECPLSAVPINHVLLTHAHGDHSRCLLRHQALRRLGMLPRPAVYYIPAEIEGALRRLEVAEAELVDVTLDPESDLLDLRPMRAGEGPLPLPHRNKDLAVSAFEVSHTLPSRGYTIHRSKKKLLPEYVGRPGPELGALRKSGVVIERPVFDPLVTFLGDHDAATLEREAHIWNSRVLIIECTYLLDGEAHLAERALHTHLDDLLDVLGRRSPADSPEIVLKHFSMRYDPAQVFDVLDARLPPQWAERIHVLLDRPTAP